MKKNINKLFLLLFILQSSLFAQWVRITDNLPESWAHANAIDAIDSNNIVIAVDSIWLSNNKGISWQNISPILDEFATYSDISIIDDNYIWAITDKKVYCTIDGGNNWAVQFYDTSLTDFINYIEMFDQNNGIIMADSKDPVNDPAIFLSTSDGGNSWHSVNDSAFGGVSGDSWRRIDFVTKDIGYFYASGINPPKLYKTTDGAKTWEDANYSGGLSCLHFYNKDIGLLYDNSDKKIHRTIDGAETWEVINIDASGWGFDIEFLPNDASKVWFADGPDLFFSYDTGKIWTKYELSGNDIEGQDLIIVDEKNGWLLSNNGKLSYNNNITQNVTDIKDAENNPLPAEFKLSQNYPNPFNPVTTIKFAIPKKAYVELSVFNTLGQQIDILVNEELTEGSYEAEFSGSNLSSGIYYYLLRTGNYRDVKKMLLLK